MPRDYTGSHVNAETFLAVLEGNASAVAGRGSGKVVASGPNDRVFVFYSDHGAPGILGMPWGPFLYAGTQHAGRICSATLFYCTFLLHEDYLAPFVPQPVVTRAVPHI